MIRENYNLENVQFMLERMGGYIDGNGMLQLKNYSYLDSEIPPHSEIFRKLSESIISQYGKKGLINMEDQEEAKKIHQLRMYIDRHNLSYVRRRFKRLGMTDEQALAAYVSASEKEGGLGGRRLRREPARLHNKYPAGTTYKEYMGGRENKKRLTPDFHAEFIIDCHGNFVSQWNILEYDSFGMVVSSYEYYKEKYKNRRNECQYSWEEAQLQIMDTESFNYACANDDIHKKLDIKPVRYYDTELRKRISRDFESPAKGKMGIMLGKNTYNYHSDRGDAYSYKKAVLFNS